MPTVLRKRRIANPGRAAPPGTPKKGSKEARDKMARLRAMRKSGSKKKKKSSTSFVRVTSKPTPRKRRKVRQNVGELVTISLGNPARKKRSIKTMARRKSTTRRRSNVGRRRVYRRRNPAVMANPRRRRRYSSRRNPSVRRRVYRRRRNPDIKSSFVQVGGVLGGAALTGIIMGMIPANLSVGPMGLVVTAGVAFAQGMLVGNFTKNRALGESMTVGGLTVVALQLISQMIPSASGLVPFGLKGLGHTYVNAKTLPPPMVGKAWLNYPMNETYGGGMLPAPAANGMAGRSARW